MGRGADRVLIFDTTLRDGEQCPGASLQVHEKLEVARQLARLGVDVIEGGFPIASPGDAEAVREIARAVRGPSICGLARAVPKDVDCAAEALRRAAHPRIHVFLATSRIHMQYKLRKAEAEVLAQAQAMVRYARRKVADVEFSPEDASRSDRDFLCRVIEACIAAGAGTINIPDTVGYTTPTEFGELIAAIMTRVPNMARAVLSVHCHNDLGLAVANSLAAVEHGARQVECTINGIGERAGNASLEEVVMALKTRRDRFGGLTTGIRTPEIMATSRLVSRLTGLVVQPNKAIVGRNAFSHESGIHQDGLLKRRTTYEIIRPEEVGSGRAQLVLGKHSGRHAFSDRLRKLGLTLTTAQLDDAFQRFKVLADKKKEVYDSDLAAIVQDQIATVPERFSLLYFHTTSGNQTVPTATIRLQTPRGVVQDASSGDGPVDACYKAIDRLTGFRGRLQEYSLRAVTGGKDAQGEVVVQVKVGGVTITGRGTSTDILEASAKAYLNAINRFFHAPAKKPRGGARKGPI